ncbi:hypothetical protein [Phytomonospora endophytica]|uniref:Uncharacterized protein n=1 Tax=Phytomonospora endophytica TaxID=714109 RepID=A0A841FM56_9ACTN|nr:hypothetical protein [Phytomonospora endophytica]MBB6036944.1 hypothetical protein [Phytomonospora endophytica]GIG68025.1 hypothetical protein Pen01_43200 [Phytomonospora endophytica]
MLKRFAGITLASVAALGTTVALSVTPAQADPWVYGGDSYVEPDPNDSGGKDAGSWMYSGNGSYSVSFQAYDEKLTVHDNLADGERAHAQVKI